MSALVMHRQRAASELSRPQFCPIADMFWPGRLPEDSTLQEEVRTQRGVLSIAVSWHYQLAQGRFHHVLWGEGGGDSDSWVQHSFRV